MKLIYCFMIVLCPVISIAQTTPVLKPLSIGDDIPNLVFSSVLNATYTSTSIEAHSDKLLLLDFWATWCASCIREFPKLDSLQRSFDGKLQILLVNNPRSGDTPEKINALLSRINKHRKDLLKLPIVMKDSLAAQLFPHNSLPHTVWILQGKVVGITDAEDISASNIAAALQGDYSSLDVKVDPQQFSFDKPLLEEGNGGDLSLLLSRSSIIRYMPGAKNAIGISFPPGTELQRRYYINYPLMRLYLMAYYGIAANRVIMEDSLEFELLSDKHNLAWKKGHYFSYELTVPKGTSNEQMQLAMGKDLDRQFGYVSRIEKRSIECLALVRTGDSNKEIISASFAEDTGFYKDASGNWGLHRLPISYLCNMLNMQSAGKSLLPVALDETGYTLPVSIDLKVADIHDYKNLGSALRQQGFDLLPCKRELTVLVISKQHSLLKIN